MHRRPPSPAIMPSSSNTSSKGAPKRSATRLDRMPARIRSAASRMPMLTASSTPMCRNLPSLGDLLQHGMRNSKSGTLVGSTDRRYLSRPHAEEARSAVSKHGPSHPSRRAFGAPQDEGGEPPINDASAW